MSTTARPTNLAEQSDGPRQHSGPRRIWLRLLLQVPLALPLVWDEGRVLLLVAYAAMAWAGSAGLICTGLMIGALFSLVCWWLVRSAWDGLLTCVVWYVGYLPADRTLSYQWGVLPPYWWLDAAVGCAISLLGCAAMAAILTRAARRARRLRSNT